MAFLRGARRSLGPILYNRVFTSSGSTSTTFATSRHKFSTWAFTKRGSLDESTQTKISIPACYSSGSVISLRRFSVGASSADQMSLIKQLRERTSAPIKDVKASLIECNWDIEAAQKDLRKRGKVLASKKSSRTATEGMLALAQNGNRAALIELNCETDFVARNEIFQHLALALAKQALISNSSSEQASGILPVRPDYLEGGIQSRATCPHQLWTVHSHPETVDPFFASLPLPEKKKLLKSGKPPLMRLQFSETHQTSALSFSTSSRPPHNSPIFLMISKFHKFRGTPSTPIHEHLQSTFTSLCCSSPDHLTKEMIVSPVSGITVLLILSKLSISSSVLHQIRLDSSPYHNHPLVKIHENFFVPFASLETDSVELTINLEHQKISGETTVQNAITEVAAMMGENIKLRRAFVISASSQGVVSTYLHTSPQPGLGRIAGVVSLEVEDGNSQSEALQRVGSELAMHVVAAKPLFLTREHVTSDALENEREILKSQVISDTWIGSLPDAFQILNSIDPGEITVKPILYASLLQTSVKVRSFRPGLQIHAHAVKSGLETDRFSKMSFLGPQWLLGIFGWENPAKAIALFWDMVGFGVEPNGFTLSAVIKACSELRDLRLDQSFHAMVLRRGFDSNNVIVSSLIDMYGRNYVLEDAKQVFDEMLEPDAICWTSIISAMTRNDSFENALAFFYSMQRNAGLLPDGFTYGTVLTACGNMGRLKRGREVHSKVITCGLCGNVVVESSLVDMYGKCGSVNAAQAVFDRMMVKNSVSWSALLGAYSQNGQFESVFKLFKMMEKFDLYSFGTVIRACAALAAVRQGKEVHCQYVRRGGWRDVIVESALVDLYAKCGCIDFAYSVFVQMQVRNLISWNSMICGLAQNGRGQEAIDLFEDMIENDIKLDYISFVGVLFACSHSGLVDQGKKYFDLMRTDYGIKPGTEHYNCMVDLLCRTGLLEEAENLIENADCRNTSSLWAVLLGACTSCTESNTAERIAKKMMKREPDSHLSYVLLANVYRAVGRWSDALKIRKLMKSRGVKKTPAKSWIETDNSFGADYENVHKETKFSSAESSGKSQMAIEKMVEGRLRKYYEDVVLMEQKFIMNDLNVKTVLDNLSQEVGSLVKIGSFFKMEVGEGIQRVRKGGMVVSLSLQDFILRARIFKLYRKALRTARRAPPHARGELRRTIRQEMENNKNCNDKQRIRFLMSEGLERLKGLNELLDMQGHP
ncbi:hypothetical protein G4B88_028269 [Cannabis sativa]|uniref:Elongation factor Ts, mitochondrial n=1 Tax=Cannabis sativa TaxID=3483 RepID=A0A7J6GD75_CANSA|nr:hypothetical protein G4B88_028269 [Cannabis sativa]